MKRIVQAVQILGAVALTLFGGAIGAAVGFTHGGWIGALVLGGVGLTIGAALAAGGLSFILQVLSIFV